MVTIHERHSGRELLDLSGVRCSEVRALAILATRLLGWHVHRSTGGITFDGESGHSFNLPSSEASLRHGVFAAKAKHLVRHSSGVPLVEPAELADVVAKEASLSKSSRSQLRKALAAEWEPMENIAAGRAILAAKESPVDDPVDSVDEPAPASPDGPESDTEAPIRDDRQVVSLRPARAVRQPRREGGADTYDSPVAMERRWSDGTVDYPCRWSGCAFVGPSLRSTAVHWRTHDSPIGGQPDPDGFDPSHIAGGRIGRVSRLAAEIAAAMEALDGSRDPRKLAEWIIDRRVDADDHHDAEPSELTPEQVLDRIARLVDRGETPRLREQLDRALVAQAQLAEQVEAIALERDQARGTVEALRDLLTEAAS